MAAPARWFLTMGRGTTKDWRTGSLSLSSLRQVSGAVRRIASLLLPRGRVIQGDSNFRTLRYAGWHSRDNSWVPSDKLASRKLTTVQRWWLHAKRNLAPMLGMGRLLGTDGACGQDEASQNGSFRSFQQPLWLKFSPSAMTLPPSYPRGACRSTVPFV